MIDKARLADFCRRNTEAICREFFPAGKRHADSWLIADTTGTEGNSLHITLHGESAGLWYDFAAAEGGDTPELLMAHFQVSFPGAVELIERAFGVNFRVAGETRPAPYPSWKSLVGAVSSELKSKLALWRGWSVEYVNWLVASGGIVRYKDCWAFPVHYNGAVVAMHCRIEPRAREGKADWFYEPRLQDLGINAQPIITGDREAALTWYVTESSWDHHTLCDKLSIHETAGVAAMCTRGATNSKFLSFIPTTAKKIILLPQNDKAGENGLAAMLKALMGRRITVKIARTPGEFGGRAIKDINDLILAGATVSDLLKILDRAEAGVPAIANSNNDGLGKSKPRLDLSEAVIREEPSCPYPPVDWNAIAQRSATSGEKFVQRAIYPEDSILASYMDASRQICEGASCWSLGAILPVVAAMLKRRVFYPRGDKRVYLNLFNFLVGRPGHRKTTALKLAEQVAYVCLPTAAFLPERCSVEALFDEYCQEAGGRPDKLWMVEEANVVMTTWAKSAYGECVAAEMLRLHDCCKLQEAFKRNKKEKTSSKGRRVIPETSTSAVFAGTFSAAAVPVARVKEGLSRRFRFYVGEAQERTIIWPDSSPLKEIIESFEPLLHLSGPIGFLDDKATMAFWEDYQRKNRKLLDEVGLDDDTLGARLSTAPDNLLKVAGLFEACRSVAAHRASFSRVPLECFELAAVHVEENLRAGAFLDKYSKRKTVQERAEVVLAVIRKDFPVQHPDTSYLSRTELTRKFCLHTGRLGALTPEDLYLYIIPELVGQGEAVLACKRGKLEVYAFRRDDKAEGDDTSSG